MANTVNGEVKIFESKKNELSLYEGCLLWGVRTIISPKLRQNISLDLHETHLGITKMKSLARERVTPKKECYRQEWTYHLKKLLEDLVYATCMLLVNIKRSI